MAKTILAGKKIKELFLEEALGLFAALLTIRFQLREYFFMCDSPRDTSHWYCQYEQRSNLVAYSDHVNRYANTILKIF